MHSRVCVCVCSSIMKTRKEEEKKIRHTKERPSPSPPPTSNRRVETKISRATITVDVRVVRAKHMNSNFQVVQIRRTHYAQCSRLAVQLSNYTRRAWHRVEKTASTHTQRTREEKWWGKRLFCTIASQKSVCNLVRRPLQTSHVRITHPIHEKRVNERDEERNRYERGREENVARKYNALEN